VLPRSRQIGFVAARNGGNYLDAQRNLGYRSNDEEITSEIPYLAPITPGSASSPPRLSHRTSAANRTEGNEDNKVSL
jgi:hypothetical protein